MLNRRFIAYALSTATAVTLATVMISGEVEAQAYQPKPSSPAPNLPASLLLSPRNNFHPSAGLFGSRCDFDSLKNDLAMSGDQAVAGVRVARLPRDTRFAVEFVVRVSTAAKYQLNASNGNDAKPVVTFFTGPKGMNRITVHAKATKEEGGFASLRCFDNDAKWSLVSATVRPE